MAESRWQKWLRNGRLSATFWVPTFIVWIYFKKQQIPLEGLDTVFILMSGVLAGNLGISVVRPNQLQPPPDKKPDDANA